MLMCVMKADVMVLKIMCFKIDNRAHNKALGRAPKTAEEKTCQLSVLNTQDITLDENPNTIFRLSPKLGIYYFTIFNSMSVGYTQI